MPKYHIVGNRMSRLNCVCVFRLGAEHDDVSTNGCPTKKHIMSARRFDPTGEAFLQFSDCSLDYFIKHIEK